MIRLSLLTAPVTVASARYPGVAYTLKRLTAQDMDAARNAAGAVIRTAREGLAAFAPYGLDGVDAKGDALNPFDPVAMAGAGVVVGSVEVAIRALIAWDGVLDESGAPAPIDRATLSILLQDYAEAEFLVAEIDKAARILAVEKNGSGPSPNGSTATRPTTVADQPIATDAARSTRPVAGANAADRAPTARKSPRPPRPRKPSPSGG